MTSPRPPIRTLYTLGAPPSPQLVSLVDPVPVRPLDSVDAAGPDAGIVVTGRLPDDATGWRKRVGEAPWVHFYGTGLDAYVLDWLGQRTVTCGRGTNAVPIAEYILAVILAAEKRLTEQWANTAPPGQALDRPLGRLQGRTVGLIGFGSIGRAVAERLAGFGVRILAARRTAAPVAMAGVEVRTLDDVLAEADHLVLVLPLTPETTHLFDAGSFARMKPGVHIVNVSRGRLIDQGALLAALEDGTVSAASLDVTDPEPLPPDHPLRLHPNAFVTSHVSWSSPEQGTPGLVRVADNLARWNAGQDLEGIVDVDAGY